MLHLIARDSGVFAVTVGLVVLDAHERAIAATGTLAVVIAVATGVAITVLGFYGHEWGHYLAARVAGARPTPSPSALSVFLFRLEETDCTRRQWLAMSLGGYLASLVGLAIIATIIDPSSTSGRVAMVLTGLGVFATFAFELPITWRVYRRRA